MLVFWINPHSVFFLPFFQRWIPWQPCFISSFPSGLGFGLSYNSSDPETWLLDWILGHVACLALVLFLSLGFGQEWCIAILSPPWITARLGNSLCIVLIEVCKISHGYSSGGEPTERHLMPSPPSPALLPYPLYMKKSRPVEK